MKKDFFPLLRGNLVLILATNKNFTHQKDQEAPAKIAIVISKKIEKKAVKRNKAKRLIEESFRNLEKFEELKRKKLSYLIFLPNAKIFSATYQDIFEEIKRVFN